MIAHGLELHRSTSTGNANSSSKQSDGLQQQQSQQQQLLQQMAGGNMPGGAAQQQMRQVSGQLGNMMGVDNNNPMGGNQNQGMGGQAPSMFPGGDGLSGSGGAAGMAGGDSGKYQDPIAQQKKRVIRQQQQRLLLLRHASKCTAGPTCKTKFCAQMVTLWKHMKKCRDKNCSTSHCLSSRCVLNHYRICKSQGRTSSCEVCGPVMEQIKRQETGDEASAVDPLTKDQEMPALDNSLSSMGGAGVGGGSVNDTSSSSQQQGPGDQQQLQQLQVAQMKLQQQLQVLKQLQRQQDQLLQQQRHLQEQQSQIKDPHTQQGQQLQQQQALLQQLQQRCQQQQVLLQQELRLQSNAINNAKQKQANQIPSSEDKPNDGGLSAPAPTSSSAAGNSKDSSSSRRGSSVRRQSKGKSMRGKGGKGEKAVRQKDKDAADSSGKAQNKPAEEDDKALSIQAKRRLSTSNKSDLSMMAGMPEPARKMIKLEPHTKDGDEEKADDPDVAKSEGDQGDDSKHNEINMDGHESKKRLVLDDTQDGDDDPLVQLPQVSRESIEKHLESLEKPTGLSSDEVTKHCLPLVQDLVDDPFGWVFRDPVDPVALGLPDYFDVVKKPMHLELVKTKLEDKEYSDVQSFQKDCSLVFENSILYNGESSEVGQLALTMLSNFAEKYETAMKSLLLSS